MSKREDVIKQINDMFDRTEADGREPIGFAAVLVHAGQPEGATTIEARTLTIHAHRMATPLLGGVDILRSRLMANVAYEVEV